MTKSRLASRCEIDVGPSASMRASLQGLRVLIVEDEPLIGISVASCVGEAGGETVRVETDRAAYAALEQHGDGIGMLIVDVNLGEGTTGFDVARFARRLDPTLPVIYLSGGPEQWAIWFGVEGASFLSKPVSESELILTIVRLAGRRDGLPHPMPAAT